MPTTNLTAPVLTEQQIARFWAKVARGEPDTCWLWTGSVRRNGYGHVSIRRPGQKKTTSFSAHVIARWLATGEWPMGRCTLHSCDVRYAAQDITCRRCVNPSHLWLGSDMDNVRDMVAKGRDRASVNPESTLRGESHGSARLNDLQVLEIRRLHATGLYSMAALGRQFGITSTHVSWIVTRKSWRHLP